MAECPWYFRHWCVWVGWIFFPEFIRVSLSFASFQERSEVALSTRGARQMQKWRPSGFWFWKGRRGGHLGGGDGGAISGLARQLIWIIWFLFFLFPSPSSSSFFFFFYNLRPGGGGWEGGREKGEGRPENALSIQKLSGCNLRNQRQKERKSSRTGR